MTEDPYESPHNEPRPVRDSRRPAAPATGGTQPFSLQAAKFSIYAPFVLILLNFCVTSQLRFQENPEL